MKAITKKLFGFVLGAALLFAAVGSASAQRVAGYYDRWGYFHPTVVYRVRRPQYTWSYNYWYWHHRHHRDWDDYRWHR
jgi:hypothetical protein